VVRGVRAVVIEARPPRIDRLPAGEIHAVGAAGLETAAMVRYLVESGRDDVVLHQAGGDFESAFQEAHRFQAAEQRVRSRAALERCRDVRAGDAYLDGIESAVAVLLPVSWFLHPANAGLAALRDRFVTYPDACFDVWRGGVVGVTGSCGKTTTTRFAARLLDGVCCGNDRESDFDLARLATEPPDRWMAFELSNRHLHNGFRRILDAGVLTGITLNHEPDHGSFEAYRRVKYSLASRSRRFLYHASIPTEYPDAAGVAARGSSFGDGGTWQLAADELQGPGGLRCTLTGVRGLVPVDRDNAVAAAAAALLSGAPVEDVGRRSRTLADVVPLYRHATRRIGDRLIVNDAAACVPASAAALVRALDRRFVLVCGGDRQRYRPGEFAVLARAVSTSRHAALVCATGPMAGHIEAALRAANFDAVVVCGDLTDAVSRALDVPGAALAFSPGCGTGSLFTDKYERGEAFDDVVSALLSGGQAVP
jgi:UDP-N-acetylmuramoylalanine-D-glutamate ligase